MARNERYKRDYRYNRDDRNENKFRGNKRYEDSSKNYDSVHNQNNNFGSRSKFYNNNTEGRYEQPGCSSWNKNSTYNSDFASRSKIFDKNTEIQNKQPGFSCWDNSSGLNSESVSLPSMFGRNTEEHNGQSGCSIWMNSSTHNNDFASLSTTFNRSNVERNVQPVLRFCNNSFFNNPISFNSNPTELTAEEFRGIPSAVGYEHQYQDESFRNRETENDPTHTDPVTMLYQRRDKSKADFFDTQGLPNKDTFLGQERPVNEFAPNSTLHRTLNDDPIINESKKTFYQRRNTQRNKFHSANNSNRSTRWNQKDPRISKSVARRGGRKSTDDTLTPRVSGISKSASTRRGRSSSDNTNTSHASDISKSASRRRITDNANQFRTLRLTNTNSTCLEKEKEAKQRKRQRPNPNASDLIKEHNTSESSGSNLIVEDKQTNSTFEDPINNNSASDVNLLHTLDQMQSSHDPQMSPKVPVINTNVLMDDTTNINISSVDNPVQPVGENLNDGSSEPTVDTAHSIMEDLLNNHSANNSNRSTRWNQKGPRISKSVSRRGGRKSTDDTLTPRVSGISKSASTRRGRSSSDNTNTSHASDISKSASRRRITDNINTLSGDIFKSASKEESTDNTNQFRTLRLTNTNSTCLEKEKEAKQRKRQRPNPNASDLTKEHNTSESSGSNLIVEDKQTNSTFEDPINNNSASDVNLLHTLDQMQSSHDPQMSPKVPVINTNVLMDDTTNINISSVDNPVQPVGENLNDSSSEPTVDTAHSIIEDLLNKIPHVSASSVHTADTFDYDSILAQLNESASYTYKSEPNMQLNNANLSPTHDSHVMQLFGQDVQFVGQDVQFVGQDVQFVSRDEQLFDQDVQPMDVISIEENLNESNITAKNTPPATSPGQLIGDNLNESHIDCINVSAVNSTHDSSESQTTNLFNNDEGANSTVKDTKNNLNSSSVENPVQPFENLSDSSGMDPIRKTEPAHSIIDDKLEHNASSTGKSELDKKHKTYKLNVSHKRPKKAKLSKSKAAFKRNKLVKDITKKDKTNKPLNKKNTMTWEISDLVFPASSPAPRTDENYSSSSNVNVLKPGVINLEHDNAQSLTDNVQPPADNTQLPTDNTQLPMDNTQLLTDNTQLPTNNAQLPMDNNAIDSGSREDWMETISPIFMDLPSSNDQPHMDSAIDSELSEVWTESIILPSSADLTNSNTESHTDSTREASKENCTQTIDMTAKSSSSPLTDNTIKLDKLVGEASSNKTDHRGTTDCRDITYYRGIDSLPKSDQSSKKKFCKDRAQIDKTHICNKLSCHSMVEIPVFKCHACHCLCLSIEETRKHIKTLHHKSALNKLLKEMTGITPISEQQRIALCKIAFLFPTSEEELLKLNKFYQLAT